MWRISKKKTAVNSSLYGITYKALHLRPHYTVYVIYAGQKEEMTCVQNGLLIAPIKEEKNIFNWYSSIESVLFCFALQIFWAISFIHTDLE